MESENTTFPTVSSIKCPMALIGPTNNHGEICRWAERQGAVPIEILPQMVDSVPAVLRFMLDEQTRNYLDVRVVSWEEFFLKFDSLDLMFVYDEQKGYNEILKAEGASPSAYAV